jgi:hypothetical protein
MAPMRGKSSLNQSHSQALGTEEPFVSGGRGEAMGALAYAVLVQLCLYGMAGTTLAAKGLSEWRTGIATFYGGKPDR